MNFLKNNKFWASISLVGSLIFITLMLYVLIGIRLETITTREASSIMRQTVKAGIILIGFSALIAIICRKNGTALALATTSLLVTLTPLAVMKVNMPAGTPIFSNGRPPGPPAGAMGRPSGPAPLNDISTDTSNPPVYKAVIALHSERSNTPIYPGQQAATTQAEQFPDIAPINSLEPKATSFARANKLAEQMGWDIIAADEATGIIEAVATTYFYRYKDDVVIRVRENGNGSIIDIRSHSRTGRGDRGKNAERVRKFIKKF